MATNMKPTSQEARQIVEDIDFELMQMEDYLHGSDGEKVTALRKKLAAYLTRFDAPTAGDGIKKETRQLSGSDLHKNVSGEYKDNLKLSDKTEDSGRISNKWLISNGWKQDGDYFTKGKWIISRAFSEKSHLWFLSEGTHIAGGIYVDCQYALDKYLLSQQAPAAPQNAAWDTWISVAKELIDAQKEYIEFLGKVYGDAYTIAYVHHYRFSKKDIDKGREMRLKIADLEKHLLPSPPTATAEQDKK